MRRRNTSLLGAILFFVIVIGLYFLTRSPQAGAPGNSSTNSRGTTISNPANGEPKWGVQNKTSGCVGNGSLQDLACTPGDIFPKATKADICTPGYASSVRNVPQSVKEQAYASYGVKRRSPGQYEVDHLVSLQLGGSNDISNLWPQPASPKPGFHEKDKVENYLHDQICSGAISLKQAQIEIATNWLAVYERMPKKSSPDSGEGMP